MRYRKPIKIFDSNKNYAEDAHPKRYISPNLFKKEPPHMKLFRTIKEKVTGFFKDIILAFREIIRRVS